MESDGVGRHVTDRTATDVLGDFATLHRHHRQRCGGRQPVGLVVAAGEVAHVHEVAEHERHRTEPLQARARPPCQSRNRDIVHRYTRAQKTYTNIKNSEITQKKVKKQTAVR